MEGRSNAQHRGEIRDRVGIKEKQRKEDRG